MKERSESRGKHSASKFQLAGFDDLFGNNVAIREQIIEVPIADLHIFKNHPFKVLNDEKMEELIKSIKERGVLVPGIARPRKEGGYELVAGHRRAAGSEIAGLTTMQVIIKDMDDDEATIIMVDSNIQRQNLLVSEKAFAYKMKFEAMKHQGSKSGKVTTSEIGEEVRESGRQIQRYIRLTELYTPLLNLVDTKKLGFIPAVDLSFLTVQEQKWVYNKVVETGTSPNGSQAIKLKKFSTSKEITAGMVDMILTRDKLEPKKVIISSDKINKYFSEKYSKQEIEDVIYKLLEDWKKSH